MDWLSQKRVFVTGATGFIGSHLVEALARRGARIRCLARPGSRTKHLQVPAVELVRGSIEQPDSYRRAVEGCQLVFHLAALTHARRRADLYRTNAEGCAAIGAVCAGVSEPPRLVYVSSLAAAGPVPPGCKVRDETHRPEPPSEYGRSKLEGEIALRRCARRVPTTIIRPGVVFGPRHRGTTELLGAICRWHVHPVIGFRTPPLSVMHVEDLVRLLLAAAESGETVVEPDPADGCSFSQGIYFACDDAEFPTYAEFGRRAAKALGRRAIVLPVARWVATGVVGMAQTANWLRGRSSLVNLDKLREAKARSWAASAAKARRQLGWAPAKELDARLKETAEWYLREAARRGARDRSD